MFRFLTVKVGEGGNRNLYVLSKNNSESKIFVYFYWKTNCLAKLEGDTPIIVIVRNLGHDLSIA